MFAPPGFAIILVYVGLARPSAGLTKNSFLEIKCMDLSPVGEKYTSVFTNVVMESL